MLLGRKAGDLVMSKHQLATLERSVGCDSCRFWVRLVPMDTGVTVSAAGVTVQQVRRADVEEAAREMGHCHRHAPTAARETLAPQWPVTHSAMWCGDHEVPK